MLGRDWGLLLLSSLDSLYRLLFSSRKQSISLVRIPCSKVPAPGFPSAIQPNRIHRYGFPDSWVLSGLPAVRQ